MQKKHARMIGAWSMNVGGKVYGPFTSGTLREFATEGRLAPHSIVAREGTDDWHEARDEPEFVDMFGQGGKQPAPSAVQPVAELVSAAPTPAPAKAKIPDSRNAHFAILVDRKSSSTGNLEDAIESLGLSYKLTSNIWILATDETLNVVRDRLVEELSKLDSLFVIDASRGKAAWVNFGPLVDARIRHVWRKAS